MKISCIIIEDEPLSRDVIIKYINSVPDLENKQVFDNAIDAVSFLHREKVDLIFLDINMPGMSGLQFLNSLSDPPLIIFTTAYPEFAVKGFEMDAIDYLLKPYSFERFLKAVNKAGDRLINNRQKVSEENALWLKSDKKMYKIEPEEILYLQSVGDYVRVVTKRENIVVHQTLSHMDQILSSAKFMRVHRSYIISLEKVDFVEGNRISIANNIIPIGQQYREEFKKLFNRP